jgi:hypothetical protein
MLNRITRSRRVPAIAGAVLVVAVIGAGTATAADLVSSKDVKDDSLRSIDVRDGTLHIKDLTDGAVDTLQQGGPQGVAGATGATGATGAAGAAGAAGAQGPKGADATYVGPNWSIVDRNVIGNADSYLRSGPDNAPLGQGSLGIRTGSPDDKAAFGNQVDFAGLEIADITALGFSVFTTGENNDKAANNMPSISMEIDPHVTGHGDYASLVYAPSNSDANQWSAIDAIADTEKHWGLTNMAGSPCDFNGSMCTFDEIQSFLADHHQAGEGPAVVTYSVAVTKGRDYAFSSAVDALRINNQVFDFEPFGVYTRTP